MRLVGRDSASQSPADIPPAILAQLGNRVQHGLRGATLQDLRAIRAAAETMPINRDIDAGASIIRLGVGQALVSTIGQDGIPTPVQIVQVTAPRASLAPIDNATRAAMSPAPASPPADHGPPGVPGMAILGRLMLAIMAIAIAADIGIVYAYP